MIEEPTKLSLSFFRFPPGHLIDYIVNSLTTKGRCGLPERMHAVGNEVSENHRVRVQQIFSP